MTNISRFSRTLCDAAVAALARFLWFVLKNPHLSRAADTLISDPENEVLISPATYWEIAIKVGMKKLNLMASYDDFIKQGIFGNEFEVRAG